MLSRFYSSEESNKLINIFKNMLTSEHTKKHEEDGFVGGLTNEEESGL